MQEKPQPIKYAQLGQINEPLTPYRYDIGRADTAIRDSGVMVVVNANHAKTAEHLVTTMWEVYQFGYVPEVVLRTKGHFTMGLVNEAMQELTKRREQVYNVIQKTGNGRYLEMSAGSITDSEDLYAAIELGFDILVGPANMVSCGVDPFSRLKTVRNEQNRYCMPGVDSPQEFQDWLNNTCRMHPIGIKIFPARSYAGNVLKDFLGPFAKDKYINVEVVIDKGTENETTETRPRIIMPTGAQTAETGPAVALVIEEAGFHPITGGSSPLEIVVIRSKSDPGVLGNPEAIQESLSTFKEAYDRNMERLRKG